MTEVKGIPIRLFCPAADGHKAVLYVYPHGDPFTVLFNRALDKAALGHCRGAENDTVKPCAEVTVDHLHAAYTAAHLTEKPAALLYLENGFHVRSPAGFCALKVDNMHMSRTASGKVFGKHRRVIAVYRHLGIVAFEKTNCLALIQIYCRIYQHDSPPFISENALRIFRPTSPLFSG